MHVARDRPSKRSRRVPHHLGRYSAFRSQIRSQHPTPMSGPVSERSRPPAGRQRRYDRVHIPPDYHELLALRASSRTARGDHLADLGRTARRWLRRPEPATSNPRSAALAVAHAFRHQPISVLVRSILQQLAVSTEFTASMYRPGLRGEHDEGLAGRWPCICGGAGGESEKPRGSLGLAHAASECVGPSGSLACDGVTPLP